MSDATHLGGLQGNPLDPFGLDLCDTSMRHFLEKYKQADVNDDYVFFSSLGWIACNYQFLGGTKFAEKLAEQIGSSQVGMGNPVEKWLRRQSVPVISLRHIVFTEAFRLLKRTRDERARGVDLFDPQMREE